MMRRRDRSARGGPSAIAPYRLLGDGTPKPRRRAGAFDGDVDRGIRVAWISSAGDRAVSSDGAGFTTWEVATAASIARVAPGCSWSMAVEPTGRRLVATVGSAGQHHPAILDVATLATLGTGPYLGYAVCWPADGGPVAACTLKHEDDRVSTLRISSGAALRDTWSASAIATRGKPAFSADGARLLLDHDDRIQLWDLRQRRVLWSRSLDGSGYCLSPDGSLIALTPLSGGYRVQLLSGETGDEVGVIAGEDPGFQMFDQVFAPVGLRLAIARRGGRVVVVDLRLAGDRIEVEARGTFASGLPQLWCAAFSPDGGRLIVGSDDGRLALFAIPPAGGG
jgi:WD40 repeat protein